VLERHREAVELCSSFLQVFMLVACGSSAALLQLLQLEVEAAGTQRRTRQRRRRRERGRRKNGRRQRWSPVRLHRRLAAEQGQQCCRAAAAATAAAAAASDSRWRAQGARGGGRTSSDTIIMQLD